MKFREHSNELYSVKSGSERESRIQKVRNMSIQETSKKFKRYSIMAYRFEKAADSFRISENPKLEAFFYSFAAKYRYKAAIQAIKDKSDEKFIEQSKNAVNDYKNCAAKLSGLGKKENARKKLEQALKIATYANKTGGEISIKDIAARLAELKS